MMTNDDKIELFLLGEWLDTPESSNVIAAQYDDSQGTLIVEFKESQFYQVRPISMKEAHSFATAPSKGKWYWQNVRVMGTKAGSKKQVIKIPAVSRAKL